MIQKEIIFLTGLHRSGTSLLHEILRSHPDISGFHNTGFPEDEGQYLQKVYKTGNDFGGPGKFAFNPNSYMKEDHPLATESNSKLIFEQWSKHVDTSSRYLIEKSPPNILRTRFLQEIFPNSKFILILRHPVAVSLATQKWTKQSTYHLMHHTLCAYEILFEDISHLKECLVIKYEDLVRSPQGVLQRIYQFLSLNPIEHSKQIRKDINHNYFAKWRLNHNSYKALYYKFITNKYKRRMERFDYNFNECLKS